MTEYWVSTPKIWCKDCKTFYDSRPINVKKHETSDRHKNSVAKRRNEVAKKQKIAQQNSENFQREMRRVESAAYRTHKNDSTYFSQFKRPPNPNEDNSIDKMLSFSKYPKEFNIAITPPTNPYQKGPEVTKEFAPPPGMKAVVEAVWLYKDSQDKVQGPFRLGEMRNWYAQNYFSRDIFVRNISSKTHKFRPIHSWPEIVGEQNFEKEISEEIVKNKEKSTDNKKRKGKNEEKKKIDREKGGEILDEFGMGVWTPVASKPEKTKKRKTLFDVVKMEDHDEHSAVSESETAEKSDVTDLNPVKDLEEKKQENAEKEMERRLERDAIECSLGKGDLYGEKEKPVKDAVKMRSRRRKNKRVVSFGLDKN